MTYHASANTTVDGCDLHRQTQILDDMIYYIGKKLLQQNHHRVFFRPLPTNPTSRMRLATAAKPLPLSTPSAGLSRRRASMPDRCVRMKGNSLETYFGRRSRHAVSHAWKDVARFSDFFAVLLWAAQWPHMYLQEDTDKQHQCWDIVSQNLEYRATAVAIDEYVV